MIDTALCLGHPQFQRPEIARIQAAAGDLAAWQSLLAQGDPATALSSVDGTFALALPLPDGRTILAVDRFAVQTLCYRHHDGQLDVDPRADRLADGPTSIDAQAIFDYLHFHSIPSPRTIWTGVQRLPPAHFAVADRNGLRVLPYWTPTFVPDARQSFSDWKTCFRGALEQAVRDQLDTSRPACFLSGGTDSSTIAGLIGVVTGQPAATFSIGFEAEGYDEMAYARLAAKHFGAEHHEYYVTPDDLVRLIPGVAAFTDQPFGNSSVLPAHCCALFAREAGITRLLAGDGGDELFGGNTRYAKQRVFGWYDRLPLALRRGLLEPVFGLGGIDRIAGLKKGRSYIEQARVPMPDRLEMYNLLRRLGIGEVLGDDFLARVDPSDAMRQQRAAYGHPHAADEIDRMLAFDWRYTLAESDLPKVRMATELAGVAVAFPMLDARLLAIALALPAHYKLRGLKLRWFFKEALRDFLPPQILAKKKQGFGLPFGPWATRHEGLHALAADALAGLAHRRVVRQDFVRSLLDQRLAQFPGYYGEMVWILMMLEQWLRSHAPDWRVDA